MGSLLFYQQLFANAQDSQTKFDEQKITNTDSALCANRFGNGNQGSRMRRQR
jgi:hypothetical protein